MKITMIILGKKYCNKSFVVNAISNAGQTVSIGIITKECLFKESERFNVLQSYCKTLKINELYDGLKCPLLFKYTPRVNRLVTVGELLGLSTAESNSWRALVHRSTLDFSNMTTPHCHWDSKQNLMVTGCFKLARQTKIQRGAVLYMVYWSTERFDYNGLALYRALHHDEWVSRLVVSFLVSEKT